MSNDDFNKNNNNVLIWIIVFLCLVISVLAFFVWKNYSSLTSSDIPSNNGDTKTQTWTLSDNGASLKITVIGDKRCKDCQTEVISSQLAQVPTLSKAKFDNKDFSDAWVKDMLKQNKIQFLPAIIFSSNNVEEGIVKFLDKLDSGEYLLKVWAKFDPFAEICDNGIDDNWNDLIDCKDPTCGNNFKCSKKVEKPKAELYVMSYCPYWLQAEKWYLEVMDKLWKVADVKIKFVQYVMHGQKEADENVLQNCVQSEQTDKYKSYLKCYLAEEWKSESCRKQVKIDEKKLQSCIVKTKKTYNVDEKMADKSKQFPDFDLNKDDALKAWVQGSPTFVLNWIKLDEIGRDAKSFADAICSTFVKKPKECDQKFQSVNFDAGFGFTTSNWANKANPQCGN